MSIDTALTEKTFNKREQKNDPTACSVWGVFLWNKMHHCMLLDAWEDHLGFPQLVKRIKTEREFSYGDSKEPILQPFIRGAQRPSHQGRKPDKILIEDKGSGISARQQLASEGILTDLYNPGAMDKLSRLHVVSPMFAHRRVWAVESDQMPGEPRSWADPLMSQVCAYVGPGSTEHDDLLDTTTQALKLIMDGYRLTFTQKIDPDLEARKLADKLRSKPINPYAP
jgi:phage terminase large subunit-like protein